MTPKRDFNKHPLSSDEELERMLAGAAYNKALTQTQKRLYLQMFNSAAADRARLTVTYTVPDGTRKRDLKAVLKALDADSGPKVKIMLCQEMPRDPDIASKADKGLMREYAREQDIEDMPHVEKILGIVPRPRKHRPAQ